MSENTKVSPGWICIVTSCFTKIFYYKRANIAHIHSVDTLAHNPSNYLIMIQYYLVVITKVIDNYWTISGFQFLLNEFRNVLQWNYLKNHFRNTIIMIIEISESEHLMEFEII